jgi:hypothetical protein
MRGHCTFGNSALPCLTSGPIGLGLFAVFMACVLSALFLAALIGRALSTRHPHEYERTRLNVFTGYIFYVWRRRGRTLGDEKLTKLLDQSRFVQAIAYGVAAIIKLSALAGL